MKTEIEVRQEIDRVIADIESCGDDPNLQSHLNTVLETLLWIVGDNSMNELLLKLVSE